MIRLLADDDRCALEEFLARHADSSMFLLANSRKAGLVDRGLPFQATYAASVEDGRIEAVAAHSWLGTVIVQAPTMSSTSAMFWARATVLEKRAFPARSGRFSSLHIECQCRSAAVKIAT